MTEILCRVDRTSRTPIVFIADTVDYEKNTVSSWIKGEAQTVSLNYYHQTGPLSAADEEVLRTRYSRNFNDPEVAVRHRLPRTKKELANILAKPGRQKKDEQLTSVEKETVPSVPVAPTFDKRATDVKPAEPDAPTAQQIFAALEQFRVETTQQIAAAMEQLNQAVVSARKPAKKGRAPVMAARKSPAKRIPTKV